MAGRAFEADISPRNGYEPDMPLTYKDAGVDIDAGDELVERIKPLAQRVRIPEVLDGIGGFAGLCSLPSGLKDPVLVSGTDGVGTKLEVAFKTGVHDTVGIDLVAMCVNDVVTCGARPLFFLDYFATSKLDVAVAEAVIRGITEGCAQSGCALLGGETAELPGMYAPDTYDLAGFAVGVVDRADIIDGSRCREGDAVVAVASTGLHSNGYSLARKVVGRACGDEWSTRIEALGASAAEVLLRPTRIYARAVQRVIESVGRVAVHAMSHITGGGIPGNLPRVLPEGLGAEIDLASWTRPAIFRWLAEQGPVAESELRRTFNIGVGFFFVVDAPAAADVVRALEACGEQAWVAGSVVAMPVSTPFEDRARLLGA